MSRSIVNNETGLDDWHVFDLIRRVIEMGRISNNGTQYCYATTFNAEQAKYVVAASRTKVGTDVFHIYAEELEG